MLRRIGLDANFDVATDPFHRNTAGAKFVKSTKTAFEILDSPGGMLIGARRDADTGKYYWRITQFIMPWYTLIPPYANNALNGHAWVPMDDENCMAWSMTFHPTAPIPEKDVDLIKDGNGVHAELIPGTFRPVANRGNDYLIDRKAQKEKRSFCGVGRPSAVWIINERPKPVPEVRARSIQPATGA